MLNVLENKPENKTSWKQSAQASSVPILQSINSDSFNFVPISIKFKENADYRSPIVLCEVELSANVRNGHNEYKRHTTTTTNNSNQYIFSIPRDCKAKFIKALSSVY